MNPQLLRRNFEVISSLTYEEVKRIEQIGLKEKN